MLARMSAIAATRPLDSSGPREDPSRDAHAFEIATRRWSRLAASPESIDFCASASACLRSLARAATTSAAAALRTATSRKAPLLPLSTSTRACAFSFASPPRRASCLTRCNPISSGGVSKVRTAPFSSAAALVGPRRRDLVERVRAVHDPDGLGTEIFQHLGKRLDPLAREHADHLPLDAGGIGERTQQVEDGAGAEFDPRRADILHRRMVRRREHEADTGLRDAPTYALRRPFAVPADP